MADEPKKLPSELEFFFETAPDHRVIASNGAWGGMTPRGDIYIDFFIEKQAVPDSIKNSVSEEGNLGKIIEMKPPKRFVRELQVGVLLTKLEAQNLVKFLNERIQQLEEIEKEIKTRTGE